MTDGRHGRDRSSMSLARLVQRSPEADVLVVTNLWPTTDKPEYGIFVKRQVESLAALGVRADVLFIHGFKSPLAYFVAAATLLKWNLIARKGYRLVHAHGGESCIVGRCYLRAPLVVSFCGSDVIGAPEANGSVPLWSRLKTRLIRQLARLATATITKSREMEGCLPRRVQQRNTVIPNGVNRALFKPLDRRLARHTLGWADDDRVALFVGDPAVPRKRHWLAEAACRNARQRIGNLRLHVANHIPPDEIPLLMNAADCLLLTSAVEGSPNAVKEALMCELPVVSTDVGDVSELLEDVHPSYLSEADPERLGECVAACVENGQRGNGGSVLHRLDEEAIAQRLLSVYGRVSSVTHPPAGR
jgi:glycosyltransferase involved in cell wall biosynthesis